MDHQWKCPDCASVDLYHLDTFDAGEGEIIHKFECLYCGKTFYVEEME